MQDANGIESTIHHLFRQQSGKMVSVLTRIFGTRNIELAEDVVQDTLLAALEQWKIKGIPDNPEGWIFIVAKNKALNLIKKQKSNILFGDDETQVLLHSGYTTETTFHQLLEEDLIKDDQLRMIFACCHPDISEENQVTFILKIICGFSTAEIAKAFLTSEDTISKRLYRTKEFFRQNTIQLNIPSVDEIRKRMEVVLNSIYLLFNEGYNSTHSDELIREDVIGEAMLLCKLLTENQHTQLPETFALMALMCFHASRLDARITTGGDMILLAAQDRTTWNSLLIEEGCAYMDKAAVGNTLSSFHLEAAIAYEHCIAENFESTNWKKILEYYDWLARLSPSPVTELNKAVAVMHAKGARAALEEIKLIDEKKIASWYLYHSLLAEIHLQLNNTTEAVKYLQQAIRLTQSETERRMLNHKLALLN